MSDIKIPKEFEPQPARPYHEEFSLPSSLPNQEDSLAQSISPAKDTSSQKPYANLSETPELPVPKTKEISLSYFLSIIGDSSLELRKQLGVSKITDLDARTKMTVLIAEQANALAKLNEQRSEAIEDITIQTNTLLDELEGILNEIEITIKNQNDQIDLLNEGNNLEIEAFQKIVQAHETYINNLESIGAVLQDDGTYLIPADKIEEYNMFTKEYQESVAEFNNYLTERSAQIEEYNQGVENYNAAADELNKSLEDFAETNDLEPFYPIPYAQTRDPTPYETRVEAPPLLEVPTASDPDSLENMPPISIRISPLPSTVKEFSSDSLIAVANLTSYPTPDASAFYSPIYYSLYNKTIQSIDQQISNTTQSWGSMNEGMKILRSKKDSDPLLGDKPLLFKLLEMMNEKTETLQKNQSEWEKIVEEKKITNQLIDNDSKKILSSDIIRKILLNANATLSESRIEELMNRLITLSIGLLNGSANTALFRSLAPIAHLLGSLPKDSPAFGILFALSLANRIQEGSTEGLHRKALDSTLKGMDELTSLPESSKQHLEASVNLGLALIASKLLQSNLGLVDLLDQAISSLATGTDLTSLKKEAKETNKINLTSFTKKFPPEEAQFLTKVASNLIAEGALAPESTFITPHSVNRTLFADSLKASLILSESHVPLAQAEAIAHQAINDTFAENPKLSTKQFRSALETNLQDLGILKNTTNIVREAVILPLELTSKPPLRTNSENKDEISEETSSSSLSEPKLKAIIEQKIELLLSSQLGGPLAKEISKEVSSTFFGQDSAINSHSLMSSINKQIETLNKEKNKEYSEEIKETFNAFIQNPENLSLFLIKLMNPVYLFVHSAQTGIMYSSNTKERPLII